MHRDWNTLIYNYGRPEVTAYLLGSALEWIDHYHLDGLRVDAVASMLYRDYGRAEGEWVPNAHGGRENLEAVAFLRQLNREIAAHFPGVLTIAEESTAWPGVTAAISDGGLGFTHKWNMGWMHDTLSYMQRDPAERAHHHSQLTFGWCTHSTSGSSYPSRTMKWCTAPVACSGRCRATTGAASPTCARIWR